MNNNFTVAMLAGESSGDNLAAPLIGELQKQHPGVSFVGIGGPKMISRGFESWYSMDRLSVNGFVDPLKRLPELIRMLFSLRNRLLENPPSVFVGVDFNFFNLLLEGMLKKKGIPTVHYVSPTVWAWRSSRIKKIARSVDLMLTLYPFEEEIYRQNNIDVCFVGHPKADEYPLKVDVVSARESLGLSRNDRVLAILPGSRGGEIRYSAPDFMKAAALCMKQAPDLKLIVPCVSVERKQQVADIVNLVAPDLPVQLVEGQSDLVMRASDVVLVNSGTATLEALLLRKPMVMSYRIGSLSYALVSRLTTIPHFALPNILSGRELIPEFIQDQATPENLAAAIMSHLTGEKNPQLLAAYEEIHLQLRKNAARSAADAISKLIESRSLPPQTGAT